MANLAKAALLGLALIAPSIGSAQDLFAREQTAADVDDVYFIAQLRVDDVDAFQTE
ncbi:MAG: hypothetical protein AAGA15_01295 [Pseudomonadota bacterium]